MIILNTCCRLSDGMINGMQCVRVSHERVSVPRDCTDGRGRGHRRIGLRLPFSPLKHTLVWSGARRILLEKRAGGLCAIFAANFVDRTQNHLIRLQLWDSI